MITLPNFDCQFVRQNGTEIQKSTIQLTNFIKEQNKGLILYFYPKDNTQGCTLQATEFSGLQDEFLNKGYVIVGVSRDGEKSHENFICKQNLNIGLISDKDEQLCQYFDVIKEKNMYGKKVLGVVRSTFVFDKDGQLLHELRNVKSKEHADKLLKLLSGNGDGIKF